MTFDELRQLLLPENLGLLNAHGSDDPADFAMRFQSRHDLPSRVIAEQLACRRKALKKLPGLSLKGLLYASLALEQSSGEAAAIYKASLTGGERLIDLTGGLGIDTVFFSKAFRNVVYCERDPMLAELATYNFRRLGIVNVQICQGDSLTTLHSFPDGHFDWIFVDPARREGGRRSIGLGAASPDVTAAHDLFLRKASKIMIKASPALELSGLKEYLPSLSEIRVVSVGGECREELLLLDRSMTIGATVKRKALLLAEDGSVVHETSGAGDESRTVAQRVLKYFYEPDAAIIKAGLTKKLALDLGLSFMNGSVDYLTAEGFIPDFPGRIFRVVAVERYTPKTFRFFLCHYGITGAAIQRRDFPLRPDEIRKKYRLLESDSRYLFFTRNTESELVCVYGLKAVAGGEAPFVQDRIAGPEC
ncbi:MAG: hypothetical protein K9I59_01535 [Chlorobium sp.]|uniref:THUMP-like domain-containing protein n=1 Tax=Chlorobium sp. TaxID=1095 RepID=UPI001DA8F539|nr:hypothetical protein [Chlorobium sp.]MBN1278523.1 class I SAM-dependent methyltransferase [Chlorobiaceae bacterium]MCF8215571.1 hypothetical protein [Chlorobium sp.]MCF8270375.1 hypothetical protein [Chlorobium sp.]MCF8286744.1 hypothetical protein [Chlorobium sp.]MCF8290266.1 hypothetical protein [Chlorobium sp.]